MTSTLKPDLSYLPTYNDVGGRLNERRGTRGSYTPGVRIMSGGVRRNVPLETKINPGQVLFVSSTLEPDTSGEARINAVRPSERFGSRGGFTRGARLWLGGVPRNIPVEAEIPHGKVLFVSSKHQPDLSWEGETNVIGGRDDERHGRMGSFEHGVVEAAGGAFDMPSPINLELWHEPGQTENKFRRCGPSHFVAGVSILSGGMPMYTLEI